MSFDFQGFSETLYRESVEAIPRMFDALRHEQVYSWALYSSGDEWCYLFPTVSTVTGLQRAAQQYRSTPRYERFSLEELECALKWSPCDSPHHGAYAESMPATAGLIGPVVEKMQSLDEHEAAELDGALVEICLQVLERLDADGHFGVGMAREAVTVNLLNGDQTDEERLARARRLNPARVYDRLRDDVTAARGACNFF